MAVSKTIELTTAQVHRVLAGGKLVIKMGTSETALRCADIGRPWTVRDVATYCAVAPRTVQRWVESGKVPCRSDPRNGRAEFDPVRVMRWWESRDGR